MKKQHIRNGPVVGLSAREPWSVLERQEGKYRNTAALVKIENINNIKNNVQHKQIGVVTISTQIVIKFTVATTSSILI